MTLAEREGFEPPIRLPVCRISSAVHSTALPPLRGAEGGAKPRGARDVFSQGVETGQARPQAPDATQHEATRLRSLASYGALESAQAQSAKAEARSAKAEAEWCGADPGRWTSGLHRTASRCGAPGESI